MSRATNGKHGISPGPKAGLSPWTLRCFILFVCVFSGLSIAFALPRDYIDEALWIYRVFACGPGPAPAGTDPAAVEKNCGMIGMNADIFRKKFLDPYIRFIGPLRPKDLPKTVLYPFGGGDLFTALATYPRADEIITVSLEFSGDPAALPRADAAALARALAEFRRVLGTFYLSGDNSNTNVRAMEKGIIPGQLSLSLAAAALFGYRPVSLKYFRIEPDGAIHYYSKEEIGAVKNVRPEKLHPNWQVPDCPAVFGNMEVAYEPAAPGGHRLVHRHISANLHDASFMNSPLRKFLRKKGALSAITKAGSYLLWMDGFSGLRDLLLSQMVFMVSDSTGPLPRHAQKAGFEQVTYGTFHGAFLENGGGKDAEEMRSLWKSQPFRPLLFRFGLSDTLGSNHLMITRKKGFKE